MHPSGHCQVGLQVVEQDRHPVQPQQQFLRRAQLQPRLDLQRLQVEVRLVKAVEQHQPGRPRRLQLAGKLGQ